MRAGWFRHDPLWIAVVGLGFGLLLTLLFFLSINASFFGAAYAFGLALFSRRWRGGRLLVAALLVPVGLLWAIPWGSVVYERQKLRGYQPADVETSLGSIRPHGDVRIEVEGGSVHYCDICTSLLLTDGLIA